MSKKKCFDVFPYWYVQGCRDRKTHKRKNIQWVFLFSIFFPQHFSVPDKWKLFFWMFIEQLRLNCSASWFSKFISEGFCILNGFIRSLVIISIGIVQYVLINRQLSSQRLCHVFLCTSHIQTDRKPFTHTIINSTFQYFSHCAMSVYSEIVLSLTLKE